MARLLKNKLTFCNFKHNKKMQPAATARFVYLNLGEHSGSVTTSRKSDAVPAADLNVILPLAYVVKNKLGKIYR